MTPCLAGAVTALALLGALYTISPCFRWRHAGVKDEFNVLWAGRFLLEIIIALWGVSEISALVHFRKPNKKEAKFSSTLASSENRPFRFCGSAFCGVPALW